MATITLRLTKGSPLTFTEADNNFSNLNNEKIERTGSIDFTGAQSFVAGTATSPGIRFAGDTNTGIYSPGADHLSVATTGAQRVTINSTGNWTFNAASSGHTITVYGTTSLHETLHLSSGSTLDATYGSTIALAAGMTGSIHRLFIGDGSGWQFRIASRSGGTTTDRVQFADNGQVTFNQASSGPTVSVNGAARTTPVSVSFSATPTFNAAQSNVFYFGSLTGNVTSTTISNATDGQTIQIRFVQDATGGRTVTVPSGAQVSNSINTTANSVTWLVITYVSSASRWEGTWTRVS